jgi:hypothetical protein
LHEVGSLFVLFDGTNKGIDGVVPVFTTFDELVFVPKFFEKGKTFIRVTVSQKEFFSSKRWSWFLRDFSIRAVV